MGVVIPEKDAEKLVDILVDLHDVSSATEFASTFVRIFWIEKME